MIFFRRSLFTMPMLAIQLLACHEPESQPASVRAPVNLLNSRIIQQATYTGSEESKNGQTAENLLLQQFKTVYRPDIGKALFDSAGRILMDRNGTYLHQPGRILVKTTYSTDTLKLNDQGYVIACHPQYPSYLQPTCRYAYNAFNQLVKEEIDYLYFSYEENGYKVTAEHQYAGNNRIGSTFTLRGLGSDAIARTASVRYEVDPDLMNSGLPTIEVNAIVYGVGGEMFYNLEKKHPSLYGMPNRNLVRTSFMTTRQSTYYYRYAYEFNAKQQVASMYVTDSGKAYVKGFYQLYTYQE